MTKLLQQRKTVVRKQKQYEVFVSIIAFVTIMSIPVVVALIETYIKL